jgi:hypothetical protein
MLYGLSLMNGSMGQNKAGAFCSGFYVLFIFDAYLGTPNITYRV